MYWEHGINHEQFLWDLRSEPGLIEAFGKIWGTEELAVSYGMSELFRPSFYLEVLRRWNTCCS